MAKIDTNHLTLRTELRSNQETLNILQNLEKIEQFDDLIVRLSNITVREAQESCSELIHFEPSFRTINAPSLTYGYMADLIFVEKGGITCFSKDKVLRNAECINFYNATDLETVYEERANLDQQKFQVFIGHGRFGIIPVTDTYHYVSCRIDQVKLPAKMMQVLTTDSADILKQALMIEKPVLDFLRHTTNRLLDRLNDIYIFCLSKLTNHASKI